MAPRELNSESEKKGYDSLDQALADSFPASDPISVTVPTLPRKPTRAADGNPSKKRERGRQTKQRSKGGKG